MSESKIGTGKLVDNIGTGKLVDNTNAGYEGPYVHASDYDELYTQLQLTKKALKLVCNYLKNDGDMFSNPEYWLNKARDVGL